MEENEKLKLDEKYMRAAIKQAQKAYAINETPIGCVIVYEGKIIGRGYNRRNTDKDPLAHAEIKAIKKASKKMGDWRLEQCTMYVTLEPCQMCAGAIIQSRLTRVVVGCMDPNPKVSGRGIALLRDAGIEVTVGVLEEECRELNRPFMIAQTKHRPYILLKWAQSADGFLDIDRGAGEPAARFSTPLSSQAMHALRAQFDSIAVGSGTLM